VQKAPGVSEQLQRYFAAVAGGGIAVTWLTAGFVTALICLVVAGASYAGAAMAQRGGPSRKRATRPRRVAPRPPQIEIESQPPATGTYGW
jgi:hypothetical protein